MNVTELTKLLTDVRSRPDLDLMKAWTQAGTATSGITAYDLEAPAKKLYPVITPLRNRIPRVTGGVGIQANWRAITGINTTGLSAGVSGGNRGGIITSTTSDNLAAFRGMGLEDTVSFEAEYAAKTFDDVKSISVEGLLRSLMIQEERTDLGGQASWAIGGATVAPVLLQTAIMGGGTTGVTTGSYGVYVVPLTMDGMLNSRVTAGVPNLVSRTNADSTVDTYGGGNGSKSPQGGITLATAGSVMATCSAIPGAAGYAWFWGATGAELLGAITTINSVLINSTAAGGTQNVSAVTADNSQNSLLYDGLLTQSYKAGSNSYISYQPTGTPGTGTPLTSDGAGGITEIDTALQSMWDNYRLSPTDIYVNSQEMRNITKKVLNATTTAAQRFVFDAKQGMVAGGSLVVSYLNKYGLNGAVDIPIHLHPNMPAGTILLYTDTLPYPLSNVPQVLRKLCRRDYYQLEWPLRTRKYEYGVYFDGVLQNYFTPAFGVIANIGNG